MIPPSASSSSPPCSSSKQQVMSSTRTSTPSSTSSAPPSLNNSSSRAQVLSISPTRSTSNVHSSPVGSLSGSADALSGLIEAHLNCDSSPSTIGDHEHAVIQSAHIIRRSNNSSFTQSGSSDSDSTDDVEVLTSPPQSDPGRSAAARLHSIARRQEISFAQSFSLSPAPSPPRSTSSAPSAPASSAPNSSLLTHSSSSPRSASFADSVSYAHDVPSAHSLSLSPHALTPTPSVKLPTPTRLSQPHSTSDPVDVPSSGGRKASDPKIFTPSNTTAFSNTFSSHPSVPFDPDPDDTIKKPTSQTYDNHKTPNVYINGLPPYCAEVDLLNMASQFGTVVSVRSFTRHVGDRVSGYGFVLFDCVESAERCIEALRLKRNLHPSFSKQIHKIPGTTYGPSTTSQSSISSFSEGDFSDGQDGEGSESFKARMERLKDETSTNLYIEGLPLDMDEKTLNALVSPHGIKSSRFFQTKLSHPPKIIAFVRLETRQGALEIIDRLHGRMLRGWNLKDHGGRISARFADTSEQRELRRSERATREGEHSPARITIAQAALLNLRGQEMRRDAQTPFSGVAHPHNYKFQPSPSPSARQLADKYTSYLASHGNDWYPPSDEGGNQDMQLLLESLRSNASPEYNHARRNAHGLGEIGMGYPNEVPMPMMPQTQTHARTGFTPAEELILHAHSQTNRPGQLRGSASGSRLHNDPYQQQYSPANQMAMLPPQWEDEFQAQAQVYTPFQQHSRHQYDTTKPRHNANIHPPHVNARLSNYDNLQHQRQQQQHHQQQQQHIPSPAYLNDQVQTQNYTRPQNPALLRSTALQPLRSSVSLPNSQHQRHYQQQHNSISIPNSSNRNTIQNNPSNNNFFHHNVQHGIMRNVEDGLQIHDHHHHNHTSNYQSNAQYAQNNYDNDLTSPPLVSPALTYNSSRTPSTLSPATPFFGSFVSSGDGFENVYGGQGTKVQGAGTGTGR